MSMHETEQASHPPAVPTGSRRSWRWAPPRTWITGGLAGVLVGLAGCGSDTPSGPAQPSTVQGTVAGDESAARSPEGPSLAGVEGAVVVLARVQADGSLEVVSSPVTTDASGNFVAETSLNGVRNLVVVASQGESEWKAVVSGEVRHGTTVTAPPLTAETTFEAEVHVRVHAGGQGNLVSFADLAAYVNSEVSASATGRATAAAELATALAAEARARSLIFADAAGGATQTQLNAAANARVGAQARLESDLRAAGSNEGLVQAAVDTHHRAVIDAYVDAGIGADAYARALEASTRAMVRASLTMSAGMRMALERSGAELRARAVHAGVRARMSAIGAGQAGLARTDQAAASLRVAIRAAASVSALSAAFDAYHDAVVNELAVTLSAHATAITSLDAQLNESAGVRSNLSSGVSAAATTEAIVATYVQFYNGVRAQADAQLAAASSFQITAAAEILILANMHL